MRRTWRKLALALVCGFMTAAGVLEYLAWDVHRPVYAEEAPPEAAPAAGDAGPAAAPAAAPLPEAAPPPAAGGVGAADQPAEDEEPAPEEKSVLVWFYEALGLFYTTVFLGLSFTFVALLVMNLLSARRENICPAELIENFEEHVKEGQYQEAYDLAHNDESFLGQVLSAGLAKLSVGYAPAIEAMQEVGEEENMKLEHRLSYMALIGTISPMVGLFGTVDGMVRSFSVIAISNTTPKPAKLAAGISTALVTTIIGLAIAIPAIAAFNILRNIIARRVLEVGIVSEGLMRSAMENAKKK